MCDCSEKEGIYGGEVTEFERKKEQMSLRIEVTVLYVLNVLS